jgi:hypothetical protein
MKPLIAETTRVCSFFRAAGLNWAKAMRDIRSPPYIAWGFIWPTAASCSPVARSSRKPTMLVVPMSKAMP